MNERVADLLATLDTAYNKRSWHGTNLRGSIRGLTARQAVWRPARHRHNIWELVVHAAYWKYTGIVAHDLYHAGQIQLIKRLQKQ